MNPAASIYGRFFQLGYVVRNIDAAIAHAQRRMGAEVIDLFHDVRDASGNETPLQNLAHLSMPGVELELIQPRLNQPSIYLEALPAGEADMGFHHLGFLLPDQAAWDAAISQLNAMQTPIVMEAATSQVRLAYIDTRRHCGHYSELILRFDPNMRRLPS